MKCNDCGGDYKKIKDSHYRVEDEFLGSFTVPDVEFLKCGKCGEVLLSPETVAKIENEESRVLDGLLQNMPISAFLSSAETAAVLGISRQALHKHRRISRGFIFQTSFGGSKVYLKESVECFRKKGDGRFKLIATQADSATKLQVARRDPACDTPLCVAEQNETMALLEPKRKPIGFNVNDSGARYRAKRTGANRSR